MSEREEKKFLAALVGNRLAEIGGSPRYYTTEVPVLPIQPLLQLYNSLKGDSE
jgi:hypothetical protein